MTAPENSAVGSAAEKSDTQTAETCVACGRLLIPRGPNGECLRCLGSFAFAPESEPSMMTPPSYAHFEVEVGADGHPVELGAGAMGVTYLARDTTLECTVALKVIDTQRAGNPALGRDSCAKHVRRRDFIIPMSRESLITASRRASASMSWSLWRERRSKNACDGKGHRTDAGA